LYATTYYVTVYDAHGCDTVLSVEIHDPSDLATDIVNLIPATCFGYCDGSVGVAITFPGTPPYEYIWNTADTVPSLSSLCSGNYTVTITDAESCVRIETAYIPQPDSIHIVPDIDGIICFGGTTDVSANVTGGTPAYSYLWSTGATGQLVNNLTEGNYYVIVTDSHGCKDTNYFYIPQPPILAYDSAVSPLACALANNGAIALSVFGGVSPYHYIWSNGSHSQNLSGLASGNYSVTVSDNLGCSFTSSFYVGISDYIPPVDATADDYHLYLGQSTNIHATWDPDYLYRWIPGETMDDQYIPNPHVSPTVTTTYYVTVIDQWGCENTDTVTITVGEVFCEEPYIYVPNAFTPNADNNNDVLYVYTDIAKDFYFAIYDRWGECVFSTEDVTKGWDGTFRGRACDPAVFVYYLRVICLDEKTFIKKGNITLIR
jgi:gliding motility-associated-like protein